MMLGIVWTHSRMPRLDMVPDYFYQLSLFNTIGEDCVAPFFLITAFLYYRNYQSGMYWGKLKTRIWSLIVPYILWNAIGALGWFLVMHFTGDKYISDSQEFTSFVDVVSNIFASKYTVLWYVGVIIVYALVAPLFYYLAIRKRIAITAVIFFLLIGILFHHPYCSPLVWMSIYMMGAYLGVHYKEYFYKPQPFIITLSALILYPLAFYISQKYEGMLVVNFRQWSSVFFFIGLYDVFDRYIHFLPHRVYKYSFFLYATHYIPLHFLQRYIIINNPNENGCWFAYIVIPFVIVCLCCSLAFVLDKYCHKLYSVLSGNR